MRAYIDLQTNLPDLHVDYVELQDKEGNVYNFNPNNSSSWDLEDGCLSVEWRGVDIDEDDASGHLAEIPDDCEICAVGANYDLDFKDPCIVFMKFKLEDYPGNGDIITKKFSIADVMPVIDHT